jgi:putative ubiquitin-RnfH superfamily antitoxin RatB of RatAB toxin-antitoxin module
VRPVTLGTTSGGEAVITKGLAAGEQIVREGQFLLGPGSRVEIKDTAVSDVKEEKKERAGKAKAKAQEGGQS